MAETPSAAPTDRRRRKTRDALMKAGERLFLDRGFTATTVEQLAEASDVAIGSLYGNFGSKEGLYLALVERALELDAEYCDRGWDAGSGPIEKLRGLADGYARFSQEHPAYFRLFRLPPFDAPRAGAEAERIANLIEARTRSEVDRMASALREAAQAGLIRRIDALRTARVLWAAWDGILALSLSPAPPSPKELEAMLDEFQQLMLAALTPA